MANDGSNPWKQNARDAAVRIEEELHRVVTYINDQVVPDIRRNGSVALRAAAEELQKIAQRMDDRRAAAQGQTPPTPSDPAPDKDKPQP
jgi:hypothetical protein